MKRLPQERLSEAAQRRVLQHLDIAYQEANLARHYQFMATYDELVASAYYGLCEAARKPYRGRRFRICARVWCRFRIQKDQEQLHRRKMSQLQLIGEDEPIGEAPDVLADLIASETSAWLAVALKSLQGRPRQVLDQMLAGATVGEVAAAMQLHSTTISRHLARGVKLLQAHAFLHSKDTIQD